MSLTEAQPSSSEVSSAMAWMAEVMAERAIRSSPATGARGSASACSPAGGWSSTSR